MTEQTREQVEREGGSIRLNRTLKHGLGKGRVEKLRSLVLHTNFNPRTRYDINEYVRISGRDIEDNEDLDDDTRKYSDSKFKFFSKMYGSEEKIYGSKIKREENLFFASGTYDNLETEKLEALIGGWETSWNGKEYSIPNREEREDKKNNLQTEGWGRLGRDMLNYFIRHPITDASTITYLQQAIKELAERKDLRKEITSHLSYNEFHTFGSFQGIKNEYNRVKSFSNSQNAIREAIKILGRSESDCLRDLGSSLERRLEDDSLKTPKEIALRKNHQFSIIGEEFVTERSWDGKHDIKKPAHIVNYVLDKDKEIPCFWIKNESLRAGRNGDGGSLNAYEVVWEAIRKSLGNKGCEGLENIAFNGAVLGYLNGLASLVDVYEKNGIKHTFPEIRDEKRNEIFFRNAVHPLLLDKKPIPNDVDLNTNPSLYLIAGANNGGKTTYAKAIGLLTIMSQLGAPIPAEEARIAPVKQVYTHFPKTESVTDEKGRFVDELERLKSIFEKADRRSLVLLDEPCAGTSNEDAYKVSLDLIRGLQTIGCPTVYTTHIHPLQQEISKNGDYLQCRNLYVETLGTNDNPKFTHRIREGIAGKSYGENYARMILPVEKILAERGIKIDGKTK